MSDLKFNCPRCDQSFEMPCEFLGQTVECPSCKGSIELSQSQPEPPQELDLPRKPEEALEQEAKDCPYCGEKILAKAKKCKHCGEFLDDSLRPASTKAPQKRSAEEEKVIWEGHPSGLYYLVHWIIGILLLPVVGLGLIFIIYAILDRKTRVYTHTTRKVMAKGGIISIKTHEVAIRDVRSINMNQDILERIFGLGSVEIGSAGTSGVEVQFKGIPNPSKIRDAIRKTKDEIDG